MKYMNFRDYLDELQTADGSRKRKWLAGSVVIISLLILVIWANYFTASVFPVSPAASAAPARSFGIWETFRTGLQVVGNSTLAAFQSLGRIVSAPKDLIIKP